MLGKREHASEAETGFHTDRNAYGYTARRSASTMIALAAIHDPAMRTDMLRMRWGRAPDSHADAAASAIAAVTVPASESAVSCTDSTGGTESNISAPAIATVRPATTGSGSNRPAARTRPI